jgi:hypothetical protein
MRACAEQTRYTSSDILTGGIADAFFAVISVLALDANSATFGIAVLHK